MSSRRRTSRRTTTRRKGQRNRGKRVTVAVMIGSVETKHRAATLKGALKLAEKTRVPPGCKVIWHSGRAGLTHARPGGLYRLPGRIAGLDGRVMCGNREMSGAYAMVYRPKAQSGWYKRNEEERQKYGVRRPRRFSRKRRGSKTQRRS